MRTHQIPGVVCVALGCLATPVQAQLTSPQIGWQAPLSRLAHNVAGTVTIVDADTLRVDDFRYDGGGISVYFYLGMQETQPAFASGLQIGSQLLGQVFDGGEPPLVIDLPTGQTMQGWNAVSVWCVAAGVSFGQGTFAAAPVAGDLNGDGVADGEDFLDWQRGATAPPLDAAALGEWRTGYAPSSAAAVQAIPEPRGAWLVATAIALLASTSKLRVQSPRPNCKP